LLLSAKPAAAATLTDVHTHHIACTSLLLPLLPTTYRMPRCTVVLALALLCARAILASASPTLVSAHTQPGDSRITKNLNKFEVHNFNSRRLLASAPSADRIELSLSLLGRHLTVELERDTTLFGADYKHVLLGDLSDPSDDVEEPALTCVFKARVSEMSNSYGAFSMCGGGELLGTIYSGKDDDAQSFTVQPTGVAGEHVVYAHKDINADTPHTCGVTGGHSPASAKMFVPATARDHRVLRSDGHHAHEHGAPAHDDRHLGAVPPRKLSSAIKTVGIIVFNDNARYKIYGVSTHREAAMLAAVANARYQNLPSSSPYHIQLQVLAMYSFSKQDGWTNSYVSGEVPSNDLLDNFNSWCVNNANVILGPSSYDVRHLLSGNDFQGATIGLAFVGGLCEPTQKSSMTQTIVTGFEQQASTMAHELGHNLGMEHDDQTINGHNCNNQPDCIMAAASSGANTAWSTCSVEWLTLFFQPGGGYEQAGYLCAEQPANPGSTTPYYTVAQPVCGDGIRQGSEECDCLNKICTGVDSCCNGATCKLKTSGVYQCSQMDACCVVTGSSCTISSDNTNVCRAAVNSCDVAEKCDATHAACPPDVFAVAGSTCTTATLGLTNGHCFGGTCLHPTEQCHATSPTTWTTSCAPTPSTCTEVECYNSAAPPQCEHTVPPTAVTNGMNCGTNKGCYGGLCIGYSSIPTGIPATVGCSRRRSDSRS
jgi:hypothetical protein